MTRLRHRPREPGQPFAAVHVRLGDFSATSDPDAVANNVRLPIDWYVDRVLAVQTAFPDLAVRVFSDGSEEDLRSLLELSGGARAEKRESITDLLDMSQAAVLIASRLGFSTWASFLGGVSRISMTGRSMEPFSADPPLNWKVGFGAPTPHQFVQVILDQAPAAAER